MIDLGTGNNNKINWAMEDKQEMIDIVETIYRFNTEHESLIPYHIQTQLKIGYHYRAPSAHPDLGSKSDRAQICMTSHCEMRGQQLEILGNEIKFETKKQKEWVRRKHMTIVTNCKNIFQ